MKNLQMTRMLGAALILGLFAIPAQSQVEITFEGYSSYTGAVDQIGSIMDVYGVANPAVSAPAPAILDYDNFQYTIHISGMTVVFSNFNAGTGILTVAFDGGEMAIYEDAIGGGTAANYGSLATFTDGDMILHAQVDNGWTMNLDDPLSSGAFSGAGYGTIVFDGGSSLTDLLNDGYTADDWAFAGTGISDPRPPFFTVPAGFDRVFGVKLIFPTDPTPTEAQSWGNIKNMYR
jgi:hypothetical protein